ncbi:hypothetical protein HYH02_014608 [Chlamydomonas schloesseri]|uniref:Transcription elongation factor n=1 Tax=Chlamydomonas schloesseri TaxID=2026947 RepID=A0A835SHR7_9CHLO|nr:hypothetical protein HYH02_014608 [Chlamydomonas schloesseri]|eukprot:KAG2427388.1 hypothetical protein HYH02_014608 [Chlamydomonas schloesseri]
MLDVLKQLQKRGVTADLLKRTNAGKRLNKFCKHASDAVSKSAKAAVEAWKQCVKKETAGDGGDGAEVGASQPGKAPEDSAVGAGGREGPSASAGTSAPASTAAPASGASGGGLRSAGSSQQLLTRQPSASSSGFVVDPPRCGNDTRDKVRCMLAEALAVGYVGGGSGGGGGVDSLGPSSLQSPNQLGAAIEEALYELMGGGGGGGKEAVSGEYKAKARSLCFNLKDAKNPDLRERVLSGSVPPEALVRLSAEEMASDEQKKKNRELKEWLAKEAVRGGTSAAATTDMFQCGRCKQRKTTYYQLQTRSADEPMTTFVTCMNCGQRWKFC